MQYLVSKEFHEFWRSFTTIHSSKLKSCATFPCSCVGFLSNSLISTSPMLSETFSFNAKQNDTSKTRFNCLSHHIPLSIKYVNVTQNQCQECLTESCTTRSSMIGMTMMSSKQRNCKESETWYSWQQYCKSRAINIQPTVSISSFARSNSCASFLALCQ